MGEGMFDDEIELGMFDLIANDLPNLVRVQGRLWKLRPGAAVDPDHTDFLQEKYVGPYEVVVTCDSSTAKSLTMDPDQGLEATRDVELYVTRLECERVGFGFPKTGDVISFLLERLPGPLYFDIQNVHDEGRLPQGRAFVIFRLECKFVTHNDPSTIVGDGETCWSGRRID